MDDTRIVGIDCATQPKKVGLSLGELRGGQLRLLDARLGDSAEGLLNTLKPGSVQVFQYC